MFQQGDMHSPDGIKDADKAFIGLPEDLQEETEDSSIQVSQLTRGVCTVHYYRIQYAQLKAATAESCIDQ